MTTTHRILGLTQAEMTTHVTVEYRWTDVDGEAQIDTDALPVVAYAIVETTYDDGTIETQIDYVVHTEFGLSTFDAFAMSYHLESEGYALLRELHR